MSNKPEDKDYVMDDKQVKDFLNNANAKTFSDPKSASGKENNNDEKWKSKIIESLQDIHKEMLKEAEDQLTFFMLLHEMHLKHVDITDFLNAYGCIMMSYAGVKDKKSIDLQAFKAELFDDLYKAGKDILGGQRKKGDKNIPEKKENK